MRWSLLLASAMGGLALAPWLLSGLPAAEEEDATRVSRGIALPELPAGLPHPAQAFSEARVRTTAECPPYPASRPVADTYREFYFTRGAYSGGGFGFGRSRWATDYEKADRQFITVIERVLNIDTYPCENPILLSDPHLRRFPFLYMVEVGYLGLTPPEVEGLRSYLLQGGFVLVDDFWGSYEWQSFEREIRQVLPEFPIVEIPMDHLVFRIVYPVDEVLQVPSVGNARRGVYHEQDGFIPHMRGIFNDEGRLMVAISWNSDMGDAWEWAEQPDYPWDRSNYALQMGMNFIVYATTH